MKNIRDYICRICISIDNKIYKLFTIGYHKDGGYFLSDLIKNKKYEYLASKIKVGGKIGTHYIPLEYKNTYSIKLNKPKISHHIDGKSHISGENITSGYEKNGNAKGLSINEGWNLNSLNDGGPIFSFVIGKGIIDSIDGIKIEDITNAFIKKQHFVFPENIFINRGNDLSKNMGYAFEAFHIHKSLLIDNYNGEMIEKNHPIYGKIYLYPLHSPETSPYILGLFIQKIGLENQNFLAFGGTPGKIGDDGKWEQLNLILTSIQNKNFKTLDRNK